MADITSLLQRLSSINTCPHGPQSARRQRIEPFSFATLWHLSKFCQLSKLFSLSELWTITCKVLPPFPICNRTLTFLTQIVFSSVLYCGYPPQPPSQQVRHEAMKSAAGAASYDQSSPGPSNSALRPDQSAGVSQTKSHTFQAAAPGTAEQRQVIKEGSSSWPQ